MLWTRREWLAAGAGTLLGSIARTDGPKDTPRPSMGIVIHSYSILRSSDKDHRLDDPFAFLELCRSLGAGGAQTSLGVRDEAYAEKLHDYLSEHKLFLEGSITLPRDNDDLERFTKEVQTAKRCGVAVFRTVLMNGRRYEVFDSAEAFRKFHERGKQALAGAKPVVEKYEVRMAVENHKDLQATELLDMVKKLDCPFIGVCLDTGNSIALLETPDRTLDMLAPHTFTTHIKDMGVEECADGFLLAEVPLGTGFLDLPNIVATLRKARPEIHLNLEMITRDPLKIPCLTAKYWATLDDLPGRRLAEMLALVRAKAAKKPLPRIRELTKDEQFAQEGENVRACLRYAKERLQK
ncbi:MAG TPA: TIM barrel protein [Gemmataceae bacterium]|jgi:sugar phosphate isomerase/epimerase